MYVQTTAAALIVTRRRGGMLRCFPPGGISEDVVRTVSENAAVLGFSHASFEKE